MLLFRLYSICIVNFDICQWRIPTSGAYDRPTAQTGYSIRARRRAFSVASLFFDCSPDFTQFQFLEALFHFASVAFVVFV